MIELAPQHKRGLVLNRPVMNAAGTLGFAGEYRGLVEFDRLGAFVTNPLTFSPRTPATPPNALPYSTGVLIHTGLPNPGLRAALRQHAREWARMGCPVIVHLAATTISDVRRSAELLEREDRIGGVELGLRDDVSKDEMAAVIRAIAGALPLVVRLPIGRAAELSAAAVQAGADALTVAAPARATLPISPSQTEERASGEAGPTAQPSQKMAGRLYGPDQFGLALEAVRTVAAQALGLPLIGAGGIFSVDNAREMLEAGAVAVQVDAAVWRDPSIFRRFELGV